MLLCLSGLSLGCSRPAPMPQADTVQVPKSPQPEIAREYRRLALKNLCPQGPPLLQGKWRFVGDSKASEFSDVIALEGTRYVEEIASSEAGTLTKARIEGEIRCLFKNRVLVMVDKVEPPGAFDNQAGDAYPCDILKGMGADAERRLLVCFFDWDLRTSAGKEFEFERIP